MIITGESVRKKLELKNKSYVITHVHYKELAPVRKQLATRRLQQNVFLRMMEVKIIVKRAYFQRNVWHVSQEQIVT